MDRGVATTNNSCSVESAPINDTNIWTFQTFNQTTTLPSTSKSYSYSSTNRESTTTTIDTTSVTSSRPMCSRWFSFNTISNQSTNAQYPTFTFCFSVDTVSADVTIQANTWVPCSQWKSSGASDPLIELHSESGRKLLAENDDGNSIPTMNCFGSVLSYRLPRGDYRAVIRNPKCAYGFFELRVLAETSTSQKRSTT